MKRHRHRSSRPEASRSGRRLGILRKRLRSFIYISSLDALHLSPHKVHKDINRGGGHLFTHTKLLGQRWDTEGTV